MKVGDKFKPSKQFFDKFRHIRHLSLTTVLTVERMPSKSGRYKYGVTVEGRNYGFNDDHVIPFKIVLENK